MAEPVYKKITELDVLSTAIDGSETLPIVKAGKTYRRTLANLFGTGWIASLLGAFSAFKAPDADHADDADTVGGETKETLHTANNLTGVVPLPTIPAELTGKNAATATLAADATKLKTARTIGGVAFDGSANINLPGVNATGNQNTSGKAATAGYADSAGSAPANGGTSAACSGNAATATIAGSVDYYVNGTSFPAGLYIDINDVAKTAYTNAFSSGTVPNGHTYIRLRHV